MELAYTDERVEASLIDRYENGGLVEFSVSGFCPARYLVELGSIPKPAGGADGEDWIEAGIPRTEDPAALDERFIERHPTIELTSKHTRPELTPLFSVSEFKVGRRPAAH